MGIYEIACPMKSHLQVNNMSQAKFLFFTAYISPLFQFIELLFHFLPQLYTNFESIHEVSAPLRLPMISQGEVRGIQPYKGNRGSEDVQRISWKCYQLTRS